MPNQVLVRERGPRWYCHGLVHFYVGNVSQYSPFHLLNLLTTCLESRMLIESIHSISHDTDKRLMVLTFAGNFSVVYFSLMDSLLTVTTELAVRMVLDVLAYSLELQCHCAFHTFLVATGTTFLFNCIQYGAFLFYERL